MKGVEKPNTIIKLPDGRIGTICYNHLDGCGGVWGKHNFDISEGESSFNDIYPAPRFMLRKKKVEELLRGRGGHRFDLECVGEDYEIIREGWY